MYERYMKTTHIYLWLFSKTETIWKWKINCDIEHFIKTGKLKSPNWWCQVSVFNVILAVRRDMTSTQTYTHVASTATMSFLSCVPLTTEKCITSLYRSTEVQKLCITTDFLGLIIIELIKKYKGICFSWIVRLPNTRKIVFCCKMDLRFGTK